MLEINKVQKSLELSMRLGSIAPIGFVVWKSVGFLISRVFPKIPSTPERTHELRMALADVERALAAVHTHLSGGGTLARSSSDSARLRLRPADGFDGSMTPGFQTRRPSSPTRSFFSSLERTEPALSSDEKMRLYMLKIAKGRLIFRLHRFNTILESTFEPIMNMPTSTNMDKQEYYSIKQDVTQLMSPESEIDIATKSDITSRMRYTYQCLCPS